MKNGISGLFGLAHTFCDEDSCCREKEPEIINGKRKMTWTCIHDQTGCLYNDGHNGCSHKGKSLNPLETH